MDHDKKGKTIGVVVILIRGGNFPKKVNFPCVFSKKAEAM